MCTTYFHAKLLIAQICIGMWEPYHCSQFLREHIDCYEKNSQVILTKMYKPVQHLTINFVKTIYLEYHRFLKVF